MSSMSTFVYPFTLLSFIIIHSVIPFQIKRIHLPVDEVNSLGKIGFALFRDGEGFVFYRWR